MVNLLKRLFAGSRRERDDYHVVIDGDSGTARAVNFHKYLLSAEGRERLRRMNLFAERHGNKSNS